MLQPHRVRGMSLAAFLVCLALSLPGAVAPSVTMAQDATPEALPTDLDAEPEPAVEPSALCGALDDEELRAAFGVSLVVRDSTEYDCSWGSDTSDTSLIITRDTGDFELDAQETFPDGLALEVGGMPAWRADTGDGLVLFVDVGNEVLFTIEYFGTPPDDLDLPAALTDLAGKALPRLAAIPMPTEEPIPTPQGDPELEALIPTAVGDAEMVVDVYTAQDLVASMGEDDPDGQADMAALEAFAVEHGRTLDDVSFADAYFDTGTAVGDLFAIRLAGADVAGFQDALADLVLRLKDPQREPATISGRQVTIVTEGTTVAGSPDPSAEPEEPLPPSYLYSAGDVLFIVSADEPQLSELFSLLP